MQYIIYMCKTEKSEKSPQSQILARDKIIVRTSVVGIIANVFLSGLKAVTGLITNSIAIILDSLNNLSDALSSIVTIIGAKLAAKRPDKKHPMGHGRIEYISAMLVAAIVLYAGITSAIESVKKIIHPQTPEYSFVTLIILAAAIIVKLVLSRFVKAQGKKVNSSALVASGADAFFDAILSSSVLLSAAVFIFTKGKLSLEAYVGILISAFIIKSGIEMLVDTISDILGRRADPELTKKIKHLLCEEPEVRGAFDLFLNNYGPEKNYASVHLELPDTMTVEDVDRLTRRVQIKVFKETGVILTGVGVYSFNTKNDETAKIRNAVVKKVMDHDWALQLHGFYLDEETKEIRFDIVLSFDVNPKDALATLYEELSVMYPDYIFQIAPDVDFTD